MSNHAIKLTFISVSSTSSGPTKEIGPSMFSTFVGESSKVGIVMDSILFPFFDNIELSE